MKKTLIILVLLFSSSVFADDISDFEIEGMSIGDSLLDYMSEEEILKEIEEESNKKSSKSTSAWTLPLSEKKDKEQKKKSLARSDKATEGKENKEEKSADSSNS